MNNKITFELEEPVDEVGQFYRADTEIYLLAQVGPAKFQLINLRSGGYYTTSGDIPSQAFASFRKSFTLIKSPFTVTPDIS
jgi:hypothetical protein